MKSLFYWMVFQVLVGIWIIISPFVLGYGEITHITINNLIFGAVVIILGIGVSFAALPVFRHAEKKASLTSFPRPALARDGLKTFPGGFPSVPQKY
jgi:hypothetical protein